jgi:hypothetical protein
MKKIHLLGKACVLFAALSFTTACKKTNIIEPPALPDSRILEYKISTPEDSVYASINHQAKTIKAIVPYYYYLPGFVPTIRIPAGAKLSPASGTVVDSLASRIISNKPIKYTVTGKDGATAVYNLTIETQQPAITAEELSTDAANPLTFKNGDLAVVYGTNLIKGKTSASFINNAGTEVKNTNIYVDNEQQFGIQVLPAAQMPPGLYKVRISSYSRTYILNNPIKVVAP